jgi:fumarate reductase subunit C
MRHHMNRNHLLVALLLLVVALAIVIQSLDFGDTTNHYYVQFWLPIALAIGIGALAMHTSHMWQAIPASVTTDTKIAESVNRLDKSDRAMDRMIDEGELDEGAFA